MEPESSLPHSHEPAICPSPKPHQSSPYPHIPLPEDPFNIILPSMPESSGWFFFSVLPTKTLYTPLHASIHAKCPALLILLGLITRTILGEQYRSLSSSLCTFLHFHIISSLLGLNILLSHSSPWRVPKCNK